MYTAEALEKRVKEENEAFHEKMVLADGKTVLFHAYEIAVKDELVCEIVSRLDDKELTEAEIKLLMEKPNTLDYLFEHWLDCEASGLFGAEETVYKAVGRI